MKKWGFGILAIVFALGIVAWYAFRPERLVVNQTSCTPALSISASSRGTSATRITVSGLMWTYRNIALSRYGARGSVSISELPLDS